MQLSDDAKKMAAAAAGCTEAVSGGVYVTLYTVLAVTCAVGFLAGLFAGLMV